MNHLGCFREVQESERSYVGPSGERMALNDLHKSGSLSRERPHAGRGFYVRLHRHGAHIETHRHRNRTSVELYVILATLLIGARSTMSRSPIATINIFIGDNVALIAADSRNSRLSVVNVVRRASV